MTDVTPSSATNRKDIHFILHNSYHIYAGIFFLKQKIYFDILTCLQNYATGKNISKNF